ncbi:MAG: radical SAM protein [Desulfobacteraceae bacterium]
MSYAGKVKEYSADQAVKMIVNLLSRSSEDRFIQLTQLGETLTSDPEVKSAIQKVRRLLQDPDSSAKDLFKRVLEYLPYENKKRLFFTLFHNAWFKGGKIRDQVERERGFRPPFIMILSPTLKCNLRCKGCYTLGYGTKPELSFETADSLLTQAEELGIFFVTVLGGEPLVYPHLFPLMEAHPEIFFQVYSNATLLDDSVAERFSRLGNVAVVLSIEGYEDETDSWRGKGVFKKIMEAMDHLREHRVLFGASATVTRHNVETICSEEWVDMLIEKGIVAQNYFLYIPVNGMADFSLMVTPEQRDHLRRQVLKLRNTRPIFVLDFWNDGPYVQGCIAGGRRYFHVNAKGDVEPCVYTHIATDNIHETSLADALDSPLFRDIRRRQPHNQNHLRPCMIIDNPHVMREVIQCNRPYFTHEGAEEIYTEKAPLMDEYASRYGELAERIWAEEYTRDEASHGAAACGV